MAKKVNNTKRKLTFIDIVIVLAILALVGFVVYSVFIANRSVSDSKAVKIEYQIKVEKVKYEDFGIEFLSENKIKSDFLTTEETVYFAANSKEIGKILSVEYEPYMQSTGEVNENGELIYAEYPGYINLIITVQTNAEKTNYGFRVWDSDLLINSDIEFRTKTYCGVGKIIEISGEGDEQ